MEMGSREFCPQCLLADLPEGEALREVLSQWLEALPEESRAEPAAVEARLARCRTCPELNAGLCRLCGCYVEYRAAQAKRRCPAVPANW